MKKLLLLGIASFCMSFAMAPSVAMGTVDELPPLRHACLAQPALSLDACAGSRDCFAAPGGAEVCALPAGWHGSTNTKCECPGVIIVPVGGE